MSSICHLQELNLGGKDNNHSFQSPKLNPIDNLDLNFQYLKMKNMYMDNCFLKLFILGKDVAPILKKCL
jgi:hypothetical protein